MPNSPQSQYTRAYPGFKYPHRPSGSIIGCWNFCWNFSAPQMSETLTKSEIEAAPPGAKLSVGASLHLYIGKKQGPDGKPVPGVRSWKYQYRLTDPETGHGRQHEIRIGRWPALSVKAAQSAAGAIWSQYVSQGKHPPQHHKEKARAHAEAVEIAKVEASAPTVWQTVSAWIAQGQKRWGPSTAAQRKDFMIRHFGPDTAIGQRKVKTLTRKEFKDELQTIKAPSVAAKCKCWLSAALEHALDGGEIEDNVIAGMRTKTVVQDSERESARPLSPHELRIFVEALHRYGDRRIKGQAGNRSTQLLVLILLHTGLRTCEVREGRWSEIDLNAAVWRIPGKRMKMRMEHRVPLTPAVVGLLKELRGINPPGTSPESDLIFPNRDDPDRPMCRTSTREVCYRLSARHGIARFSPHSFRSTFSTLGNEGDYRERVVDAVLAHRSLKGAESNYNKATYWTQRQKIMADWSDYLTSALLMGPHQDK